MRARATTRAMRARLQRSYRFEAAHFLPKVPPGHRCARMHGHSYLIEIVIEGEVDPELGWLIDFAEIDEQAGPLVRQLDHQVLNEIEGLANPTSELLAAWWWYRLVPGLPKLCEVVVSETSTSRCVFRGP
jgi:6-pyruvoyltetrahydropterin/6-carboxytetrahydropterin synthase